MIRPQTPIFVGENPMAPGLALAEPAEDVQVPRCGTVRGMAGMPCEHDDSIVGFI